MRGSRRRLALGFALVLAAGGCARNPAPRGWLAPAETSQAEVYGAWIVISPRGATPPVAGEFLAVDADSVFVLPMDGVIRSHPRHDIRKARLAFYDAKPGTLGWWTMGGSVSTISHGFGLIFTFPLWLLGGSIATAAHSRAPIRDVEHSEQWDGARMYARFPAGLPPTLPRTLPPKQPR